MNPFPGPYSLFPIPNAIIDVVIGQNGSTIKALYQKTGAYIFIPKDITPSNERVLQLSGCFEAIDKCRLELIQILRNVATYAD